jgi:hypothetical protein
MADYELITAYEFTSDQTTDLNFTSFPAVYKNITIYVNAIVASTISQNRTNGATSLYYGQSAWTDGNTLSDFQEISNANGKDFYRSAGTVYLVGELFINNATSTVYSATSFSRWAAGSSYIAAPETGMTASQSAAENAALFSYSFLAASGFKTGSTISIMGVRG